MKNKKLLAALCLFALVGCQFSTPSASTGGNTSSPTQTAKDGETPYIGENGNWWIGEVDTGVPATGPKGDKGDTGETGPKGDKGDTGDTGAKGDKGDKGDTGEAGTDGTSMLTGNGAPDATLGKEGDVINLEVDPKSHPVWTGVRRLVDTGGQLSKFKNKFGAFVKTEDAQ